MAEKEIEMILAECQRTLAKKRAVGTGIGVFCVIIKNGDPLLRKRLEKDSLYQKDLSGKWEMTGGGTELSHFKSYFASNHASPEDLEEKYQGSIFQTLKQELQEESGLELLSLPDPLRMIPAWLWRSYTDEHTREERTTIDLAFSFPVPWESSVFVRDTKEFREKLERGEVMFVPRNELQKIEIVSPRTRFLIEQALQVYDRTYK